MDPRDRRGALRQSKSLNGIDFVEVVAQTELCVHFINRVQPSITGATITGGEAIPTVRVQTIAAPDWTRAPEPDGRPLLTLRVDAPGDFSTYTLTLLQNGEQPNLDPFFDHVRFSFKALDGEPPPPARPSPPDGAPPIDYLAKDFQSFKKALLDFSALRHPAWQERSEADFGVMFMEALASLADDLSYLQDRIAAEAWIETATQRRSLVRLARLVDYEPRVATAARVLLQLDVASGMMIPVGMGVSALSPDGTPVMFETGTGMTDPEMGYRADPAHNRGKLQPYWWDDSQRWLPPGATEMWIEGGGHGLADGQLLLIDTTAELETDPPVREVVRLAGDPEETYDALYQKPLTRIVFRAEDALRFDHDLGRTQLAGNLVPATQGKRVADTVVTTTAWPAAGSFARALVRTGANGTLQFLHTLRNGPLAWLAQADPGEAPRPEIDVVQIDESSRRRWTWRRTLLDAKGFDDTFTVDPVRYRAVATPTADVGMADYDGDDGETIRFGDGVFGAIPEDGAVFEVTYRVGGGARGNVAADTITHVDPSHPRAGQVLAVTNPLAAEGGADAEPAERIREMAPQAFHAGQLRAVRREDYERAAETLPWVQRAGTSFRHTGSWLSVFTAVDPKGGESLPAERLAELVELLDRRRLAGYESYARAPRYASLDLEITVSARPDAFRGDVKRAVLAALDTSVHEGGTMGFFHPDCFIVGMVLHRSALESFVQEVPGVAGVMGIQYRRSGSAGRLVEMLDTVPVAIDEVVRVDNDPSRPERGSLLVDVRGGK